MNLSGTGGLLRPWGGIAESIVCTDEPARDYSAAMLSPCEKCPTAPCCFYLPLGTFRAATLSDLDYAIYLLNFDRIELGLSSSGDWSIFYRHPCRFLDRKTFACTIHGQPDQPHICQRYNPYQCWYKPVLTRSTSASYLRLDRTRLQHLITGIGFDDRGNIVESPDWAELVQALENLYDPPAAALSEIAPSTTSPVVSEPLKVYTFGQLQQPCDGCPAHCCKVLMFPVDRPADITGLDYLKFCLGFPGIRIGISEGQWAILVDTTCRHLRQNRCSVFGLSERPLACRYYDEWRCAYKVHFEHAESMGLVYVGLEQYRRVVENVQLDSRGSVLHWPTVEQIRALDNAQTPGQSQEPQPEASPAA